MQIQTYRDKVTLTTMEVERIIKDYIKKETGQTVHGNVIFHMEPAFNTVTCVTAELTNKDEQ